ncbi:MAG: hypothetical protein IT501_05185 [Rubrivivax sp.]|nr:hypothetical protein [Rubrivivax sp.]
MSPPGLQPRERRQVCRPQCGGRPPRVLDLDASLDCRPFGVNSLAKHAPPATC